MTASVDLIPPPAVPSSVTLDVLDADPYPTYRSLHAAGSVHHFAAIGRYLVIGYEACRLVEMDPELYSSDDPTSLQRRAMGHSMIRKDGAEHDVERKSFGNVLKPREIQRTWRAIFEANTEAAIDRYQALGPGADFHLEFAAPLAGENLRRVIGFDNATSDDLRRWSQDLVDGAGNYADDPAVWARSDRSSAEIDAAIAELRPGLLADPGSSLLGHVLATGLPFESVLANIKLAISGGLNEPRDLMGTLVWALLENAAQRDLLIAEPQRWNDAFDEALRWVAPLAMYVRRTTAAANLQGHLIPAGAELAVMVGAANRDPAQFDDPDRFDVTRVKMPHLGFGNGPHFCAGSWLARSMVAEVAMPRLFERLPDLRLDPEHPATARGWVFRGATNLPLIWN